MHFVTGRAYAHYAPCTATPMHWSFPTFSELILSNSGSFQTNFRLYAIARLAFVHLFSFPKPQEKRDHRQSLTALYARRLTVHWTDNRLCSMVNNGDPLGNGLPSGITIFWLLLLQSTTTVQQNIAFPFLGVFTPANRRPVSVASLPPFNKH